MNNMLTKGMKVQNGVLYLGSHKISDIAREYDTPLYVYDEENIRYKLDLFKNNFKSDKYKCHVIYASKAFFCPYLSDIIKEYGMYMDSVSMGDLYMISKASFPAERVVLHGNNKDISELEYAISNNVGMIVVDNFEELKLLDKVSTEKQKLVNVILRVNPGIAAHTHEYIQTSTLNSKFGESVFDIKKIVEIIKYAKNTKYITMKGFHCHIGSSINDETSFTKATVAMLDFIMKVEKTCGFITTVLDLGGGFGIKYLPDDHPIDIKKMLKCIIDEVDQYISKFGLNIQELYIEPGRSIVGDSGVSLYTASMEKNTYGKKEYVFVDGGMTDNIRPALYRAKYYADLADKMNDEKELVDIAGPCCESGDIIAEDTYLPKIQRGDIVIVYSTGAYGYSMSSNYNGRLKGSVIFVNKDKINYGVKRESLDDLTSHFPVSTNKRIFDCHSDMLFDLWTKKSRGIDDEFTRHVNQLNNSVVHGGIWTMYSPFDFDLVEACNIAIKQIDMKRLDDFQVILGIEGLRNLEKVEDLDVLYKMGFRHAMVTWNEANRYATGAKSDKDRGITEEGRKLYKRMEELGMIIDLAHLNEKCFYEALDIVHKNIMYSHGLCKIYCDHPRNITDDQMRALKKVDGLFGLTLADSFISKDEDKRTMDMFLKHVQHAISIMGIDNVCFGFDFMDYLSDFPNSNLKEVNNATLTYRIIEGLEKIGLKDDEIDKICYTNVYKRFGDKVMLRSK